jgi:hypothetical protein
MDAGELISTGLSIKSGPIPLSLYRGTRRAICQKIKKSKSKLYNLAETKKRDGNSNHA